MSHILESLRVKDSKARSDALIELSQKIQSQSIQSFMDVHLEFLQPELVSSLIPVLAGSISDNNVRVCMSSLDCIEQLCIYYEEEIRPHLDDFILPVIEPLGNAKPAVREQAVTTFMALLSVSGPGAMLDRIIHRGIGHKNWRVRDNILQLYALQYSAFRESAATVESLIGPAGSMMSDAQPDVRKSAGTALSILCSQLGETRVFQMLESKGVPPKQLSVLRGILSGDGPSSPGTESGSRMSRSASFETKTEFSPLPSVGSVGFSRTGGFESSSNSASATGFGFKSDSNSAPPQPLDLTDSHPVALVSEQAPGPTMSPEELFQSPIVQSMRGFHAGPWWRTGIVALPKACSQPFLPHLAATGEPSGAPAPERIQGARDFLAAVDGFCDLCADTKGDWKPRIVAIDTLRSAIISPGFSAFLGANAASAAGANAASALQSLLMRLKNPLCTQMNDLRSSVARQACLLASELSAVLGTTTLLDCVVDALMNTLTKLTVVTIAVISESADAAAKNILHNSRGGLSRAVPPVLAAARSKAPLMRARAAEYLLLLLRGWATTCVERHAQDIQVTLLALLRDADPAARQLARIAYWSFASHFPARVGAVEQGLEESVQQLILEEEELAIRAGVEAAAAQIIVCPVALDGLSALVATPGAAGPPSNGSMSTGSAGFNASGGFGRAAPTHTAPSSLNRKGVATPTSGNSNVRPRSGFVRQPTQQQSHPQQPQQQQQQQQQKQPEPLRRPASAASVPVIGARPNVSSNQPSSSSSSSAAPVALPAAAVDGSVALQQLSQSLSRLSATDDSNPLTLAAGLADLIAQAVGCDTIDVLAVVRALPAPCPPASQAVTSALGRALPSILSPALRSQADALSGSTAGSEAGPKGSYSLPPFGSRLSHAQTPLLQYALRRGTLPAAMLRALETEVAESSVHSLVLLSALLDSHVTAAQAELFGGLPALLLSPDESSVVALAFDPARGAVPAAPLPSHALVPLYAAALYSLSSPPSFALAGSSVTSNASSGASSGMVLPRILGFILELSTAPAGHPALPFAKRALAALRRALPAASILKLTALVLQSTARVKSSVNCLFLLRDVLLEPGASTHFMPRDSEAETELQFLLRALGTRLAAAERNNIVSEDSLRLPRLADHMVAALVGVLVEDVRVLEALMGRLGVSPEGRGSGHFRIASGTRNFEFNFNFNLHGQEKDMDVGAELKAAASAVVFAALHSELVGPAAAKAVLSACSTEFGGSTNFSHVVVGNPLAAPSSSMFVSANGNTGNTAVTGVELGSPTNAVTSSTTFAVDNATAASQGTHAGGPSVSRNLDFSSPKKDSAVIAQRQPQILASVPTSTASRTNVPGEQEQAEEAVSLTRANLEIVLDSLASSDHSKQLRALHYFGRAVDQRARPIIRVPSVHSGDPVWLGLFDRVISEISRIIAGANETLSSDSLADADAQKNALLTLQTALSVLRKLYRNAPAYGHSRSLSLLTSLLSLLRSSPAEPAVVLERTVDEITDALPAEAAVAQLCTVLNNSFADPLAAAGERTVTAVVAATLAALTRAVSRASAAELIAQLESRRLMEAARSAFLSPVTEVRRRAVALLVEVHKGLKHSGDGPKLLSGYVEAYLTGTQQKLLSIYIEKADNAVSN